MTHLSAPSRKFRGRSLGVIPGLPPPSTIGIETCGTLYLASRWAVALRHWLIVIACENTSFHLDQSTCDIVRQSMVLSSSSTTVRRGAGSNRREPRPDSERTATTQNLLDNPRGDRPASEAGK